MAILLLWILGYRDFVRWYSPTVWWIITIALIGAHLYMLLRVLFTWSALEGEERLKLILILLFL